MRGISQNDLSGSSGESSALGGSASFLGDEGDLLPISRVCGQREAAGWSGGDGFVIAQDPDVGAFDGAAIFVSVVTEGWLGPSAFSSMARAWRESGSASARSPLSRNSIARLLRIVATAGWSGPCAFFFDGEGTAVEWFGGREIALVPQ